MAGMGEREVGLIKHLHLGRAGLHISSLHVRPDGVGNGATGAEVEVRLQEFVREPFPGHHLRRQRAGLARTAGAGVCRGPRPGALSRGPTLRPFSLPHPLVHRGELPCPQWGDGVKELVTGGRFAERVTVKGCLSAGPSSGGRKPYSPEGAPGWHPMASLTSGQRGPLLLFVKYFTVSGKTVLWEWSGASGRIARGVLLAVSPRLAQRWQHFQQSSLDE